jgi:hypothetical protein
MLGDHKLKIKVQFRRATSAAWTASNVVLAAGEAGFETDTSRLKFGDGVNTWDNLPYANLSSLGTIESVTAGEGLLGGTIVSNGTIAVDRSFVATIEDSQIIANKTFGATLEFLTPISTNSTDSTLLIDLAQGPNFYVTLNNNVDTVSFINMPNFDTYCYFSIIIRNGRNYSINWPASIHWEDGLTPTLSANSLEDIFYFSTIDGGSTFYGSTLGLGYDNPNTPTTQIARFRQPTQFRFGISSAISPNGLYSAAAGEGNSTRSSSVYIHTYSNGLWIQQAVLNSADLPNSQQFGYSMAFSEDGSTLVIGDPGDSNDAINAGRVIIFSRISGGAWAQTATLDIADPLRDKQLGYSVAINYDGTVVAIGAPATSGLNGIGSIYIFNKLNSMWAQSARIAQPGNVQNTAFGAVVDLDSTGNYLAIGAPKSNQSHIYNKSGTNWIRQSTLFPTNAPTQSKFGTSLSLSGDANFCIIGDPTGGVGGYAVVYGRSGTNWIQIQVVTEAVANTGNGFSRALSMSFDGTRCLITADGHNAKTGLAYTFIRNGLAYSEESIFGPSDAAEGILFGYSGDISSDGSALAITAPDANALYMFLK